jgi:hypothetical protein
MRGLLRMLLAALAAGCDGPPAGLTPRIPELPERLSQTGLYVDIAARTLAAGTRWFRPAHELWSDGARKMRYIQLPPDAVIDGTDMNHWRLPVGTRLFKEFSRGGRRLETRLIWRVADTGERERDTLMASFVWRDDGSDALLAPDGATDLGGTDHDAPAAADCWRCHVGEPGRVLGFSALQLDHPGAGYPLDELVRAGRLSGNGEGGYAAPGDPVTAAALGYLHANCGHCHSPTGGAWSGSNLELRLGVEERDASSTALVRSTVGIALQQWIGRGFEFRVVPGDSAASAVHARMAQRTPRTQMPPLATEHVDGAGLEQVKAWIDSLPE